MQQSALRCRLGRPFWSEVSSNDAPSAASSSRLGFCRATGPWLKPSSSSGRLESVLRPLSIPHREHASRTRAEWVTYSYHAAPSASTRSSPHRPFPRRSPRARGGHRILQPYLSSESESPRVGGGIETSRLSKGNNTRASQTVGAQALYERLLRADARVFRSVLGPFNGGMGEMNGRRGRR